MELAANESFTEHSWSGTGTGTGTKKEEQEWNIPGNVVHYRVTLDKIEKLEEKKVWSMKISGLQKGRYMYMYMCTFIYMYMV